MKKALIIGGSGFIGHNLVKRLKSEGWWIKVVDVKHCSYELSPADEVLIQDASKGEIVDVYYDRIYQLAADMGGAGFIFTGDNDADVMSNSASININILRQAKEVGCGTIFYSSSVCIYPDGVEGKETDVMPFNAPSNYGLEKLFSEQLYLSYKKNYDVNVRIARFHNTFGPCGTYKGGREKSPAAICRKVVEADTEIEIWGDGKQLRPFIYIDDLLDGIEALMSSDFTGPVNLGPSDGITIDQMVDYVSEIAGKTLTKKHIPGPTGGQVRNANNDLAKEKLGWSPKLELKESLGKTYNWIYSQMK